MKDISGEKNPTAWDTKSYPGLKQKHRLACSYSFKVHYLFMLIHHTFLKTVPCHLPMAMKLLAPQPAGKHMAFLQENPRSHLISALAVFSRLRAQEFPLLILRMAVEVLSRLYTWSLLHNHSCFGRWTGKITQVKNNWVKLKKSGPFLDPIQSADRSCLSDRGTRTIGDGGNWNHISHYWHQKHKLNPSHQHLS